ncbi:MAG: hypothetical protein K0S31_4469 [Sphingobacterium multivorum]|jgi:hypothetical protein|nr:hypothetical protein [Sphingobacterium multivorum]
MIKKNVLAVIALISSVFIVSCFGPGVQKGYQNHVGAKVGMESKYTSFGNSEVKSKEIQVNETSFNTVTIWYPVELETSNKQYPVVVFANGTGVINAAYEEVFKHLASWGFVAIGNDDKNSWNGESTSRSLDLLLSENNKRNSIFYQKINTKQIGVSGHSQGGVAVINAITIQPNSGMFRSAFGASTTKHELSVVLQWPYDVSKIRVPYFAVAGTGASDAGDGKDKNSGIAPLWSLIDNFNRLPSNTPSLIARRRNAFHEHMLYKADGYMTAWFLYTLTGDSEAKRVFVGTDAEIRHNSNWQDIEVRNIR